MKSRRRNRGTVLLAALLGALSLTATASTAIYKFGFPAAHPGPASSLGIVDPGRCTKTWDGPASGNWSAAGNWTGDAAPTASDHVCIGDGTTVTLNTIATVRTVQSDGSLVVSGGTLTLDEADAGTPSVAESFTLQSSGTVTGAGTLLVTSTLAWFGGAQSGTGATIIGPAATLTRPGPNAATLVGRTLRVEGTVVVPATAAGPTLSNGARIEVAPGGTIDFQGNVTIGGDASAFVLNQGTIRKSAGAGGIGNTGGISSIRLDNQGRLLAEAGRMLGGGPTLNYSPSEFKLTGGTYEVKATLHLSDFTEIKTNAAHIIMDGPASAILENGSPPKDAFRSFEANAVGSSMTLRNGRTLTAPGSFSNGGLLSVDATSTFASTGALANTATGRIHGTGTVQANLATNGVVAPGFPTDNPPAGALKFTGAYTAGPAGKLAVDIGGLTPGTQHDQLQVSGAIALGGTLDITTLPGFTPTVGQSFTIATGTAVTGDFAAISGAELPGDLHYVVQKTPTAVILRVLADLTVSVKDPSTAVPEGGNAIFLLQLSGVTTEDVTVFYETQDGTATAPGDYTPVSGGVTFDGDTAQTTAFVSIPTVEDALDENDETVKLVLTGATGAELGDSAAEHVIGDDDPLPELTITGGGEILEGDFGPKLLPFTVSLAAESGRVVSVGFATQDGTATGVDGDYQAQSRTLTFAPGETSKVAEVQINGDTKDEDDEQFTVELSSPVNASVAPAAATGTIRNDDASADLLPKGASGYRFKQIEHLESFAGFEAEGYDDSAWAAGQAPFGSAPLGGSSGCGLTRATEWQASTDLLVRRKFAVPADTEAIEVRFAVDNDVSVWVNGLQISRGFVRGEGCATRDNAGPFRAEAADLHLGTDNLIAVRAEDRGGEAYLDMAVAAVGPESQPNLSVVAGAANPTSGAPGDPVAVSWTTRNPTAFTATAPWEDAVYLSDDAFFDPGTDQKLASVGHASDLLGGDQYSSGLEIAVPSRPAGNYHLFVHTDDGLAFAESTEADNVFIMPFTVTAVQAPLTAAKTADASPVSPGAATGYTITISNPNSEAVAVDSMTDGLPSGFSYAGPTTGATTSNPTVEGQKLAWKGPFTVPAEGSVSLHFGVTAATTPGTYLNTAGAEDETGQSVVTTGPTAEVAVVPAACIAGPPPAGTTPAGVQTWKLADDFAASSSNPAPDSHGNTGIWHFCTSAGLAHEESGYTKLPVLDPDILGSGLKGWYGSPVNCTSPALPIVLVNPVSTDVSLCTGVFPGHAVAVHPTPSRMAIVAWRSPVSGSIRIAGGVADIDPHGGDGVQWFVAKGSSSVASGSIANGGAQEFPAGLTVPVAVGDALYFGVHPGGGDDYDSTRLDVTLTFGANHAPHADDDSYELNQDGSLTAHPRGVLVNDDDADGDELTAVLVDGPAHGTLTLNADGSFTYVPASGFNGTDTFVYKASDGQADSNLAVVTLRVKPLLEVVGLTKIEGTGGLTPFGFTVRLTGPTSEPVTVDFATVVGTAGAADFQQRSGTLSFTPGGALEQTVTVQVVADALDELDEQFLLRLANPQGARLRIGHGEDAGVIVDDDAPPTLEIGDVTVGEGNSGLTAAVFKLTLSAPSGKPVTVPWSSADGTATAGSDYQAASGTVTFALGETIKTLSVNVLGDTVVEPDETFLVNLGVVANATVADGQGVGTIRNDDTTVVPPPAPANCDHPSTIRGTEGADSLTGTPGDDIICAGGGADIVRGLGGNDLILGGAGEDWLLGDAGNDTLRGEGGAEILDGGAGNDTLEGAAGNDFLRGGSGDDQLSGGGGSDTADYAAATAAIQVDLAAGTATGDGQDALAAIEDVQASPMPDRIAGDERANGFYGGGGADEIDGRGGDDTIFGQGGNDELRAGAGPDNRLVGGEGSDFCQLTPGGGMMILCERPTNTAAQPVKPPTSFATTFTAANQTMAKTVTVAPAAASLQLVANWQNPAASFAVSVELVDGNGKVVARGLASSSGARASKPARLRLKITRGATHLVVEAQTPSKLRTGRKPLRLRAKLRAKTIVGPTTVSTTIVQARRR